MMNETAGRALKPEPPSTSERLGRVREEVERLGEEVARLTDQLAPVLREPEPSEALRGIDHPGESYLTRWLAETAQALAMLGEQLAELRRRVDL